MARKKQNINLKSLELKFVYNGAIYRPITFNPTKMSIEAVVLSNNQQLTKQSIPFAHLPKNLKRIINPK